MTPEHLRDDNAGATLESLKFFVSQSTFNDFPGLLTKEPDLPMSLGKFELLKHLGSGGMGSVFLARQSDVERLVALKVVRDYSADVGPNAAQAIAQLRKEAEFASEIQHPNIVTVYEFLVIEGVACISMQYVDGSTARDLSTHNQLTIEKSVQCTTAIGQALSKLHTKGVVHRDVKPGNILCSRDGEFLLSDFGIAFGPNPLVPSEADSVVGTVLYASPEQLNSSNDVDVRSDVYSLGATLYHLLTGRAPFRASSMSEAVDRVSSETPITVSELNTSVDKDLEAIVMCSMEKSPLDRYQTVDAMLNDLSAWSSGKPTLARPIGAFSRVLRWCKREPVLSVMAGLCIALLSVSTFVLTVSYFAQASATKQIEAAYETQQQSLETSNELLLNMLSVYRSSVSDLAKNDGYRLKAATAFTQWLEELESRNLVSSQKLTDARVRFSLGGVFDEIGDPVTARELFSQAETSFASAVAEEPKWNFWLGQIKAWHAKNSMASGNPTAAIAQFDKAIELIDSSGIRDASLPRAKILSLKSLALQKIGKSEEANVIAASLVVEDFDWDKASATELANLGHNKQRFLNNQLMRGELENPLAAYEAQNKFWEKARSLHPDSYLIRYQHNAGLVSMSVYLRETDPARSLLARRECYRGFKDLLEDNPGRRSVATALFSAASNLVSGELELPGGKLENAAKVIEETQQVAARLEPVIGTTVLFRSNYSQFLGNAAIFFSEKDNAAEALEMLVLAESNLNSILEENPENSRVRRRLIHKLTNQSRLLSNDAGIADYEKAVDIALRAATESGKLKSSYHDRQKLVVADLLADLADLQFNANAIDDFQMIYHRANEVVGNIHTEFLEQQFDKLLEFKKYDAIAEVIQNWPNEEPAVMEFFKRWNEKLPE